ncbi:MAG: ABC transporter ATP-binding protein [Aggregatilineales bacterium]
MKNRPLECTDLYLAFDEVPVLNGISFSAEQGQIVALLGPSGCGKTTTLRLIAGFEWPSAGTIHIKGRLVAGEGVRVPPEERRVGMVFQEYALFPHLSVRDNITFGLNGSRREREARALEMMALVGLRDLGDRMPHELSGGQQQRVALARALAPQPDILLLDEPFSNLDAGLRQQVRVEVRAILKAAGITCVFVTHDQQEAFSIADQVVVMMRGEVAQIADARTLYNRPATHEVAAFVGESNFLPGMAEGDVVTCALGRLPLDEPAHGPVEVLVRPSALRIAADGAGAGTTAIVRWVEFQGDDQRVGLELIEPASGQPLALMARVSADDQWGEGETVVVRVQRPVRAFAMQPAAR